MKTSARLFGVIGLCSCFILAPGCVRLQKAYPEKRKYAIEARRSGEPQSRLDNPILAVRVFNPPPVNKGSDFIYRIGPNEFVGDFYNGFIIEPGTLLSYETAFWLAASGIFNEIVPLSSRLKPDYVLEGYITALHGEMVDRAHPSAVMSIEFLLIDETKGASQLRFHKHYLQRIPIENADPAAVIEGWNKALGNILGNLENDLRLLPVSRVQ